MMFEELSVLIHSQGQLSDSCFPSPTSLRTPDSELSMKLVVYSVQTGIPSPKVWRLTFVLCERGGIGRKGCECVERGSTKSITACFLTPFPARLCSTPKFSVHKR